MVLACDSLGITFMPTFPNLPDKVIEQIKSASNPNHVILNEDDALKLEPHKKGLVYTKHLNDLYTVIFTSGTTGEPKAVGHSRLGCTQACIQNMQIYEMTSDDVVLAQLPPSTIAGLYLYPLPGLMKGCTVIMEQFNPRRFIELNQKFKPTVGIIVPAMMIALSKLKAHPLQLEITDKYQYKLDRYGVLWLKGDSVMKGYLNMDAEFDSEGYWCTGDVFERRHNLLFFKSRKTDLIKVNSFNVSPVSIENALIIHPEVNEVCVTYRDRDLGEKEIVAIVSSENQINNTELFAFIKDKLINYELWATKNHRK